MRNTFDITFYCRKSRMNKKGLAPIELAISMNGERKFISLPLTMNPTLFEKQIYAKTENGTKKYIAEVESKIKAYQIQRASEGLDYTIDTIREYVKGGFNANYTMQELWDDFFTSFRKKGTTPRNERKYELVMEVFFSNILPPNAQVSDLIHLHIVQFERHLKTHFADSTAANMLSKFRSIVLFGISIERITVDPFKGIHIRKKAKEVDFLSAQEVDTIRKKRMPNERLEKVKDLFLFQCFTALSYCDMAALVPEDFQQNQFGQIYIEKCRAKTKVLFCTVLFEDAIDIARKYDFRLPGPGKRQTRLHLQRANRRKGVLHLIALPDYPSGQAVRRLRPVRQGSEIKQKNPAAEPDSFFSFPPILYSGRDWILLANLLQNTACL